MLNPKDGCTVNTHSAAWQLSCMTEGVKDQRAINALVVYNILNIKSLYDYAKKEGGRSWGGTPLYKDVITVLDKYWLEKTMPEYYL